MSEQTDNNIQIHGQTQLTSGTLEHDNSLHVQQQHHHHQQQEEEEDVHQVITLVSAQQDNNNSVTIEEDEGHDHELLCHIADEDDDPNEGDQNGTTLDQSTITDQLMEQEQDQQQHSHEHSQLQHHQQVITVEECVEIESHHQQMHQDQMNQQQQVYDDGIKKEHESVEELLQVTKIEAIDHDDVVHHQITSDNGSGIITIPVGSLAPYTVLSESETGGHSTISVTIADSQGQNQHHQLIHHQQQQQHQQDNQQRVHIIQEQQQNTTTISHSARNNLFSTTTTSSLNNHASWEDAVSSPILPIRCKDTNAELVKGRFGSGNKGKCIKHNGLWFTPTEFEALCGRGNSKDWKRSIRFGGRTLQTLIDKGFLIPHASSCICSNCVDDAAATGPMRPFTPYQRKRKSQSGEGGGGGGKSSKLERLTSKDSSAEESSDIGTPGTPFTNALNPLSQALMKINHPNALPACNQEAWKAIEDSVEKLVSASILLKSNIQEMKNRQAQQQQQQQQQQQHITVQSQDLTTQEITLRNSSEPQILRIFDTDRIQTFVLDPETYKQLQSQTQQQQHQNLQQSQHQIIVSKNNGRTS